MSRKRIVVNGRCPVCGAPAYVGLHTRVECTRRTCDRSPGMRALGPADRKRVRKLRVLLEALEGESGKSVEAEKRDVQRQIDAILSVDPLH